MIKKIVITGGAGYIGNQFIEALPKEVEIVVIDNFTIDTEHKRNTNKILKEKRNLTLIEANVSETSKYKKFLKNADALLYMASLNSYKESNANPTLYMQENNIHLQIFLNALKEASPNLKKCILTSTRGVYGEGSYKCLDCGNRFCPTLSEDIHCAKCSSKNVVPQKINENDLVNPASYYGLTKKIQEDFMSLFCVQNKVPLDIFRIFNVYGEDQGKYYSHIGIIPQIFSQITESSAMYLSGNGYTTRDFIYIGDIVKIFLSAFNRTTGRAKEVEVYNLGSGEAVSINNIAEYFEKIGYTFAKNKFDAFGDIQYSVADNLKLKKDFNIDLFNSIYDFLDKTYKNAK